MILYNIYNIFISISSKHIKVNKFPQVQGVKPVQMDTLEILKKE